jgi:hypothetical protein
MNLSLDGMLVGPADPVLTGEKIIVSFPSPIGGEWIDAEATVTRVLHGRRPGEYRRALGLKFEKLDARSRAVLQECLRRIPPTPPGARSWTPDVPRRMAPTPPGARRWTPDVRLVQNALNWWRLSSARLA